MSITAHIFEISPDSLEKMQKGENVEKNKLKISGWLDLDRSWYGFHKVFKNFDTTTRFAIQGEFPHPESQQDFEKLYNGETDHYIGLITPSFVKQIYGDLSGKEEKVLLEKFNQVQIEFDDYYREYLGILYEAYRSAVENGNGLCVVIS